MKEKRKFSIKFLYPYMLLALFVLNVAATYTWFALSKTPSVSDIGLFVSSPVGIELSWDRSENSWGQQLDYAEAYSADTIIRPVTWSDADQCFYAAEFGADGRIVSLQYRLFDTENVNRDDALGFYLKMTFFARTDKAVSVLLTPVNTTAEHSDGSGTYVIGSPVWNAENLIHDDGGKGADCSIRLGFRITPINDDGTQKEGTDSSFFIYEPNCNKHIDGSTDYVETTSVDGADLPLTAKDHIIRQTATGFTETDPVANDVVIYDYGEFVTNTRLFKLENQQTVQIDLYVWLEGQDIDCTNEIGDGARIFANILFFADYDGQSGLDPIK